MKNLTKRLKSIALVVSLLLVFALLAGCSNTESDNDPAEKSSEAEKSNDAEKSSDSEESSEASEDTPAEIPHIKLRILDHGKPNFAEKPKYNDEVMAAINEKLAKDLGFTVEIEHFSYADDVFGEKMNLDIAGGEVYDLIRLVPSDPTFASLANKGMLKDLTSIIENNAPYHMETVPQNVWDEVTVGDGIYGLPATGFKVIFGTGWIRGEWLDKANLEMPTNIAEFEAVMKAFRDGDFDGNGQDDTVPYATVNAYAEMSFLGLFTDTPGDFVDDNGAVRSKYFDPGYKEYVAMLADWYSEGYIDDLFFNGDDNSISEMYTQDRLGIAGLNVWHREWGPINAVDKNRPEVKTTFMKQFDNDMKMYFCPGLVSESVAATANSENAAYAIAFTDWYLSDQENYNLVMRGIEGKTWAIVDNAVVVPEGETATSQAELIGNLGCLNSIAMTFEYYPTATPEESKRAYDYAVKDVPSAKLYVPVTRYITPEIGNSERLAVEDANAIAWEVITDIIKGKKDISAYDEMLEEYEDIAGGYFEVLTEEYKSMN